MWGNTSLVDAYGSPSENQVIFPKIFSIFFPFETPVDYTVNNPESISERHREEVERINSLFRKQQQKKPKVHNFIGNNCILYMVFLANVENYIFKD